MNINIKINIIKTIIFVITFLIAFQGFNSCIIAEENLPVIQKKSEMNIDTSVIVDSENYSMPKQVLVAPIFMGTTEKIDYEDWYRGLFYYLSSDRYNFKDIPAHYIIDKNGNIYQGIDGGIDKQILVDDKTPIVIFYLAQRGDSDFSENSKTIINNFLINIANENSIEIDKFELKTIKLEIEHESKKVYLQSEKIYGTWHVSFDNFMKRLEKEYDPQPKKYEVELINYKNPKGEVSPLSEIVLKIELKNTSKYSIYSEDDSALLLTKADQTDSKFYLNNTWVSKSQVPLLLSNTILKPDEKGTFQFKIRSPLEFGAISEDFVIKNGLDQTFEDTKITIKLNVKRDNIKVLEIKNTETGTLNVRKQPTINSSSIAKASPGEKYIWIEKSVSNWYKIKYEEGKEGWVFARYVNIL